MSDMNTLDWKALKAFVAKRKPVEVSAGILNDWFWTGATVYEKGKWVRNHRAYVTSYWATPGFKATLKNGDVIEVAASVTETKAQARVRETRDAQARKNLHKAVKKIRAEKSAA